MEDKKNNGIETPMDLAAQEKEPAADPAGLLAEEAKNDTPLVEKEEASPSAQVLQQTEQTAKPPVLHDANDRIPRNHMLTGALLGIGTVALVFLGIVVVMQLRGRQPYKPQSSQMPTQTPGVTAFAVTPIPLRCSKTLMKRRCLSKRQAISKRREWLFRS